jgi:hypothetical protein
MITKFHIGKPLSADRNKGATFVNAWAGFLSSPHYSRLSVLSVGLPTTRFKQFHNHQAFPIRSHSHLLKALNLQDNFSSQLNMHLYQDYARPTKRKMTHKKLRIK